MGSWIRPVRAGMETNAVMGLMVGALMVAAIVYSGSHVIAAQRTTHNATLTISQLDDVRASIDDTAYEAQSIFVPASDVGNHSNADAHELDVYGQDINHIGHFVAFCFRGASGVCTGSQTVGYLGEYKYQWSQLPQNGGTGAQFDGDIASLSSFSVQNASSPAQFANATLDPIASPLFASYSSTTSWPNMQTYHWGYPGITSSTGQIFTVSMKSGNYSMLVPVDTKHVPVATSAVVAYQTPTPQPLVVSGSLAFQNPIAAAQSVTVSESNYGNRATTPAQNYSLSPSDCADNGNNGYSAGRNDASYSPTSPLTPASNGTGSVALAFTPVKQTLPNGPATCQVTVTDNTPQNSVITATIGQTYSPAASGGGIVTAPSGSTVQVSERNYVASSQPGFSVQSYSPSGACTATSGASSMSSDGTYTYTTTFTVTFQKQNILCGITFVDTYGQTTAISTEQKGQVPFVTWPATLVVKPSNGFVATTSGTLAYVSPKQWVARTINALLGGDIALAASSCTALAMNAAGTSPDTTIDGTAAQNALDVHVDTNGCEVNASDVPLAQPVIVAWEPSGTSETFSVGGANTCGSIAQFAWATSNTAAIVELNSTGSANGSCQVPLTDGVSTQTPAPDSGNTGVNVIGCTLDSARYCTVAGSSVNGTLDTCATNGGNAPYTKLHYYDTVTTPYTVYSPSGAKYSDTKTVTYPNGQVATGNRWCPPTAANATTTWSPGEPKIQTGDPNLP